MAESFEELPTAYIQVAGADIMRDDGILYEKKLREGGAKTKIDVYVLSPRPRLFVHFPHQSHLTNSSILVSRPAYMVQLPRSLARLCEFRAAYQSECQMARGF